MLAAIFERARAQGRAAFIPYVMAGDPDLATTALVLEALAQAGADAIEVGIAYGDPLADGPTIAAAGARALRNGVRIDDVLALVRAASANAPIVLFTYYNPVLQYGPSRFARDAADAGAAGCIVPDVALEEISGLRETLASCGVEMPLLVAPSTPRARAASIAEQTSGFLYVVSRLGVTGASAAPDFSPLCAQMAMLREVTEKPLAVGFGVSLPEHVRDVAPIADGIIVGSALVAAFAGVRGEEAAKRAAEFVKPLIAAAGRRIRAD